jgi:hypothetical protein
MRKIITRQEVPHSTAEICLNLWYFADETGLVLRLAAKAYALSGTDEEKLAILHALAATDHLTATQGQVPPAFVITGNPRELKGALLVSTVFDQHSALFSPLMDQVEKELPKLIRSVNSEYEQFTLRIPQDALNVTTGVFEREDGELIARVGVIP